MKQPNFVFIMTDTQATNVVGAYGHPEMETPCIDRLSEQGMKFERAYTTCPLCTPARAGIFTGLYPHSTGAWTNTKPMGETVKTMGHRFRDNDYRTAYIGKWHLGGHSYLGSGICPDGWEDEYWYDAKRYMDERTPRERWLWRGGLKSLEALKAENITPEFTYGHQVSNRALRFLEEDQQKPFVLVVSYDEPHGPFTCPPEYVGKFMDYQYPLGPGGLDDLSGKPVFQQEWSAAQNAKRSGYASMPMYWGCNSFVDSEIGRVVEAVDRHAPEDTYIIFTSDHGEMMGSHGLRSKGGAMYEEITHIPLIIRQPNGSGAGTSVSALANHVDLLPTMLDLAGLHIPGSLQGESLVPVFTGKAENEERDVFVEYHRYEHYGDNWGGFYPIRCIVSGNYKLSVNLLDTDELYDLERDPAELENRIDDSNYSAIRDELHDKLLDWMYMNGDAFRSPAWERRPWRKDRKLNWAGGWKGKKRRVQDDGYMSGTYNYSTGEFRGTAG